MVSTQSPKPGFSHDLVQWYEADHRDLPWRQTTDPYAIWLSEIMLQQTQVRTVLDYYHRFLQRYPSVQALAAAPLDDVLKLWEGLGYYARGRNLHKAAQIIVEQHGGQFPQTLEEAEALPGIGRSTAGAILTFGYGQKHPLLDGNVKRVLSRIADIAEDVTLTPVIKRMWTLSTELLSETDNAYAFNQGIMELGATVCLPQNPRCLLCPVQRHCDAASAGTQHKRPVKASSKAIPHHTIAVGVIWRSNPAGYPELLIQQRPAEGLLGGLWEFPGGKQEADETLPQTVAREIQEELGIHVLVDSDAFIQVKHAYSHFKITLHAFHCHYTDGTPQSHACQEWRWVQPHELTQYAFPKANKTVLEKVLNDWQAKQAPKTSV